MNSVTRFDYQFLKGVLKRTDGGKAMKKGVEKYFIKAS